MEQEAKMILVDLKTWEDLNAALAALADYQLWLISRQNLDAVEKLQPIASRLGDLFAGIAEGFDPAMGPVIDALNQFAEQTKRSLEQAGSQEEVEAILKQFRECMARLQARFKNAADAIADEEKKSH